jgi:hypothetical protein
MRVKRLKIQYSTYPRLFSWPGREPDSAHPIPELFHTGRNNPTDPAPMLDKTHKDIKNKEQDQLERHNSKETRYTYKE